MASSKKKAKANAPPKVGDWLRITCSHSDAFYSRVKEVRKASSAGTHHVYVMDRYSMTMRFLWRAGGGKHHKFGINNHYAHLASAEEGLRYEARVKFWHKAHQKSERVSTLLEDTSIREDDKDLFTFLHGEVTEFFDLVLQEQARRQRDAELLERLAAIDRIVQRPKKGTKS